LRIKPRKAGYLYYKGFPGNQGKPRPDDSQRESSSAFAFKFPFLRCGPFGLQTNADWRNYKRSLMQHCELRTRMKDARGRPNR